MEKAKEQLVDHEVALKILQHAEMLHALLKINDIQELEIIRALEELRDKYRDKIDFNLTS